MSEKQFYLLQVNDALFPIGGYSHSQGLETYIQRGIVHNVDTAREYITHKIKWNLAYTELLARMESSMRIPTSVPLSVIFLCIFLNASCHSISTYSIVFPVVSKS